jgi:hypothetical protein
MTDDQEQLMKALEKWHKLYAQMRDRSAAVGMTRGQMGMLAARYEDATITLAARYAEYIRPKVAPKVVRKLKVGDKVRLVVAPGYQSRIATITGLLSRVEGGVTVEPALVGLQCWNERDLVKVKPPVKRSLGAKHK